MHLYAYHSSNFGGLYITKTHHFQIIGFFALEEEIFLSHVQCQKSIQKIDSTLVVFHGLTYQFQISVNYIPGMQVSYSRQHLFYQFGTLHFRIVVIRLLIESVK
jgi:hypothetical protein